MHEWLDCIIKAEMPRHAPWQYNVEAQEVDEAPLRNQEFIGLKKIVIIYITMSLMLFCFRLPGGGCFSAGKCIHFQSEE